MARLRNIETGGVNRRDPRVRQPDWTSQSCLGLVCMQRSNAVWRLQEMETVRTENSALSSHISCVPQMSVSRQLLSISLFKLDFTDSFGLLFVGITPLNCALP